MKNGVQFQLGLQTLLISPKPKSIDNNDYIKKQKQFQENIKQRNDFLCGLFEMLELDDSYFVVDNYINDF